MTNFLERDSSTRFTSVVSLVAIFTFLPLFLLGVYNAVSIATRAAGTKAAIIVDATATLEPIKTDFYHAFAQGGEESADMIAPVIAETKALRPQLIRLDHLYDHYNIVGRSGNDLTFDFTRLDQAVNSILATGAKPILALSYMPSVIAKDGSIINPPNNWDEWALVVQRTIEHYSGRSNRNLSGVYYEVWNEPDLAQFGGWKLSGEKNYVTLYRHAAIGASRARGVNPFLLGGPSTTGLYKNWIMALVTSGSRLDFFAWHSYLPDPTVFNDDQRNLASWLLPYPRYTLLPKLITEAGFTGAKDKRYGTMFAAAHTAATVRQLISGGPTYLFSFQIKDGPGQEAGDGWGLLTHEAQGKKPKPRYYVYSFLDAMAGTRVALEGEGSWVTGFASTRNNTLRIMLVNYDRAGTHSENVPVTVNNLEPGIYSYRERFLLGRDAKFTETVTGTTFTRELFMPAQSVAVLELTRTQPLPDAPAPEETPPAEPTAAEQPPPQSP